MVAARSNLLSRAGLRGAGGQRARIWHEAEGGEGGRAPCDSDRLAAHALHLQQRLGWIIELMGWDGMPTLLTCRTQSGLPYI